MRSQNKYTHVPLSKLSHTKSLLAFSLWRSVIRCVRDLSSKNRKIPEELRETRWVPLPTAKVAVRHKDIVHLQAVDQVLAKVLPASDGSPGTPVAIEQLELEVQKALLEDRARNYLLRYPDFKGLGSALRSLPKWTVGAADCLGITSQTEPTEILAEWLEVFESSDLETVPCLEVLSGLHSRQPLEAAKLFRELAVPIGSVDRLSALFTTITYAHKRAARDRRPGLRALIHPVEQ